MELCTISAGLSAELHKTGFETIAVGQTRSRDQQVAPCVSLDLSKDSEWDLLYRLLDTRKIFYVHGAPPSGTASRYAKTPLRSEQRPQGMQTLAEIDRLKVTKANQIYEKLTQFLTKCHQHGILWSVENPTTSLMWLTVWFRELLALRGVFEVRFDECMHGGSRNRACSWWTNVDELRVLQSRCDKKHKHASWGPQRERRIPGVRAPPGSTYPELLCKRVADAIVKTAQRLGVHLTPPSVSESGSDMTKQQAAERRAASGRQPRGQRYPRLIPEFKEIKKHAVASDLADQLSAKSGSGVSDALAKLLGGPAKAKVISIDSDWGCGKCRAGGRRVPH